MSAAAVNENALSDTLFALADPTRRRMLQLLGEGPKPVGELLGEFALSAPAISKHLRVLRQCMLVEEARDATDARLRIYRLRPEPLADLDAWLAHMRAFWELQLDAFAAYVGASAHASGPTPRKRAARPSPAPGTGMKARGRSGSGPAPSTRTSTSPGTSPGTRRKQPEGNGAVPRPQGTRRPRRSGR